VIVPDYQLSLAIGKEGQNARLAAKLTGWRIDIRSDTAVAAAAAAGAAGAEGAEGAGAGSHGADRHATGTDRRGASGAPERSGGTAGTSRPQ